LEPETLIIPLPVDAALACAVLVMLGLSYENTSKIVPMFLLTVTTALKEVNSPGGTWQAIMLSASQVLVSQAVPPTLAWTREVPGLMNWNPAPTTVRVAPPEAGALARLMLFKVTVASATIKLPRSNDIPNAQATRRCLPW
jgi:hypothetical protein